MSLRITFVLPHLALSGGNKIVSAYAERLARRGHQVTVVHGPLPSLKARIASRFSRAGHVVSHGFGVKLVKAPSNPSALEALLPDGDALIATWWETVEAVLPAPGTKGRKFHLVQGHEVWPYLPARAKEVYRMPFHKIAVSNWLAGIMRDSYGQSQVSLVENPVELDRFTWKERSPSPGPTVGTLYSVTAVKNSELAFEAVKLARAQLPGLRLICFGAESPPREWLDQDFVSFILRPDQQRIPEIYRSCDFWLFTSTEEGFGLPILEAMAVGTPVIATPAGAAPDLVNDRTGRLVGLDARQMADAIVELAGRAPEPWKEMSKAARAMAEAHDIETAVSQFEAVLTSAAE